MYCRLMSSWAASTSLPSTMASPNIHQLAPARSTVVPGLAALIDGGARECAPLTSMWFVRYHWLWFSVVCHRPVIHIVLLRLPPIEPVFLFDALCGHRGLAARGRFRFSR